MSSRSGTSHTPTFGRAWAPLFTAAREWHEDVIDVLLEHGADPRNLCGHRLWTVPGDGPPETERSSQNKTSSFPMV